MKKLVEPDLTPEQELLAKALFERIQPVFLQEAWRVAQLFAGKPVEQTFGKTEFELRDLLHQMGTATLETALEERKKGGTQVRA